MPRLNPAAGAGALHYPGAVVAHRLPGRIRLRFCRGGGQGGWELGAALGPHEDVLAVSWLAANRSLTVRHRPEVSFEHVLRSLPERPGTRVPPNRAWTA